MTSHERFLATKSFGSLDGLRAISIMAVVWHHSAYTDVYPALSRGFLGVDLFFVISGFLIVTLLLRERDRGGQIDLAAFYVRRSLRIVPLNYAVILVLWFLAVAWGGNSAEEVKHDVPYALAYVANWVAMQSMLSITWSLAAEEQFYIVWPAIERWFRHAAHWLWAALILASIAASCGHAHVGLWPGLPRMLAETTFVPILFGVGLAHALHTNRGFARIEPWLGHRSAAWIVVAMLVIAVSIPMADISGVPRLLIHILCTLLVGACVIREDHALARILRQRIVVRIGVVSYGIYLLHHLCLTAVDKLARFVPYWSPVSKFALGLILSWAMAELSFRFFERRFLDLKARWAR